MATSTKGITTDLIILEDREAAEILLDLSQGIQRHQSREEEKSVSSSSILLLQQVSKAVQNPFKHTKNIKKISKKITQRSNKITTPRIKLEVDDSDETLMIIQEWNQTQPDPGKELFLDKAERYSEPIKKQLTESDVKKDQSRLMLGKDQVNKKMLPLLEGTENLKGTSGLDVLVYGPNEVVQDMKFKMWSENTPVLTSGWKEFVAKCELKKHCDFLTIWMFRDRDTRKICFAINKTRHLTITKPLDKKILKAVF